MITTFIPIAAALTLGAIGARKYYEAKKYERLLREIHDILGHHDHLAEEMLEVSQEVRAKWAHREMVDRSTRVLAMLEKAKKSFDDDDEAETDDSEGEDTEAHAVTRLSRKGELVYTDAVRECTGHMVLRSRRLYVAALAQETKNRFGQPARTSANLLAVRKYALDRMTKHGLRPTHIHETLPLVVELTFAESATEAEARRWAEAIRVANGGKVSWWRLINRPVQLARPQC